MLDDVKGKFDQLISGISQCLTARVPQDEVGEEIDSILQFLDNHERLFSALKVSFIICSNRWELLDHYTDAFYRRWPDDYETCFNRAKCLFVGGFWEDAKKMYEKTLECMCGNDTVSMDLYEDLGSCCYALGDYQKALEYCSHAIRLFPDTNYLLKMRRDIKARRYALPVPVYGDASEGK